MKIVRLENWHYTVGMYIAYYTFFHTHYMYMYVQCRYMYELYIYNVL